MDLTEALGFTAGIFTGISLLPQLLKIIKEKKTEDISLVMLLTLLAGLVLWIVYGIVINNWPIILTNSFSLVINIIIIILNFLYSRKKG